MASIRASMRLRGVPGAALPRPAAAATRSSACSAAASSDARRCMRSYPSRDAAYTASMEDPESFWADAAGDIAWHRPFDRALDKSNPPFYRWFPGGLLNTSYNCLDRHVEAGRGDQPALIWHSAVAQGGTVRTYTYKQLLEEVETAAAMLRKHGVGKGDNVVVYMPMVPEGVISMLACGRIGASHSVVFGGFAPHELAVRIDDAKPKLILTASAGLEGATKVLPYKPLVDAALAQAKHKPSRVIALSRPACPLQADHQAGWYDWEGEMRECRSKGLRADPVWVPSDHISYLLYTSGSTGAPKGVARDTGGHATGLHFAMHSVYGLDPGHTMFTASDLGWAVGHSFTVYGPLLRGCTSVLFEGKPVGTPDAGTFWRVAKQHGADVLFTAPTAIRAIKKEDPDGALLASIGTGKLKALYFAGERSDPDTVKWAHSHTRLPIIDHYWSTETGWPIVGNLRGYGLFQTVPGSAGKAVPGYNVRVLAPDTATGQESDFFSVVDTGGKPEDAHAHVKPAENGHTRIHPAPLLDEAKPNTLGPIAIRLPLPPGTLLGLFNNEARFRKSYTDDHPGYFSTGDAGHVDEQGYVHVMGRIDDVMNVAGHRLSTGAIEAAIASHPAVAECAVVGAKDDQKGQVPVALIVLKATAAAGGHTVESVCKEANARVRAEVGPIASLKAATVVSRLPKTRSGKVLRAIIRAITDHHPYRMPATIDDASVLPEIEEAVTTIGYGRALKESGWEG